ncbi:MAG: DUF3298 domain-containing protein [Lachnospiraceae bacterium]|nr:DUF3298 domain-containing protein [Lachnospiraceae bacterium]
MEQKIYSLPQEIKEQYEALELSGEQVERLKQKMLQAKSENRKERIRRNSRQIMATAAMLAIILFVLPNTSKTVALAMQQIPVLGDFIELITVRDYEYEDEQHQASIKVGELVLNEFADVQHMEASVKKELLATIKNINSEIQKVTTELLGDFETSVEDREGPLSVWTESIQIPSEEQYLVIKQECFMAAGSGMEWNYYYTIDLTTGKLLSLEELFKENADYVPVLADCIEKQLKLVYGYQLDEFLRDELVRQLEEEASFYINEAGNIVMCFDEGDIGPMSLGDLEIVISNDDVKEIRK